MELSEAFEIIDKEHCASLTIENIGRGATSNELKELSGSISSTIPSDFIEMLKWHNGQQIHVNLFLFGPFRLLDIATILQLSKHEVDYLIFADDGGSTMLGISVTGEVVELSEEGEEVLFDSVSALFIELATDIRNGALKYDSDAGSYDTSGWPRVKDN